MAAPIAALVVQITADARGFTKQTKSVRKSARGVTRDMRGLTKALGAIGGVTAVTAAITKLARSTAEFETQIKEIQTLGLPNTFNEIAGSVQSLSSEFGFSKKASAKAFYDTISSGAADASEANKILESSAKLAVAGVAELGPTAKLVNTFLNAYNLEASAADEVSDSFFATVKSGVTTIEELSSRLGNVASLAAAAGVDFKELNAAVAAATKNGQSTAIAVTGLQQSISSILKPSKEAATLANELGIEFNATALKTKGLADFLIDLENEVGGNQEAMVRLFGSVEAYRTVAAVTAQQGQALTETLEAQATAGGDVADAAERMADTLGGQSSRLLENISNVSVSFGTATSNALGLTDALKGANQELELLQRVTQEGTFTDNLKFFFQPPGSRGEFSFEGSFRGGGATGDLRPALGPEVPAGFFPRAPTEQEAARQRAAARAAEAVAGGTTAASSGGGGGGGGRPPRRRRPPGRGPRASMGSIRRGQSLRLEQQEEAGFEVTSISQQLQPPSFDPWQRYVEQVTDANRTIQGVAANTAQSISRGFGSALQNVISGAQSAGEAFATLGTQISGRIVGALAEVAVQMLIVRAAGEAVIQSTAASTAAGLSSVTATTAAAASSLAAAWGPAATAASIATLGGAAGVGLAAFTSALGAGTAATIAAQATTAATGAVLGGLQGVAHDGLERVPTDGTYLLQRNEAVLSRQEAEDFRQGRSGVTVNNFSSANVRTQQGPGGMQVIIEEAVVAYEQRLERQLRRRRGPAYRAVQGVV